MGGVANQIGQLAQTLGQVQQNLPQQAMQNSPMGFPQMQPPSIPGLQQSFNLPQGFQQGMPQQQMQYQPIGQPQMPQGYGNPNVMQPGPNVMPQQAQQRGLGGLQLDKFRSRLG
jgi:hypothetical protein